MHRDKRVLHYFLRSSDITDQQRREPHQRAVMNAVQLRHCPVGFLVDRAPSPAATSATRVSVT